MNDHRSYIDAVGTAVQDLGVSITAAIATRIAGRREALLRIDPRATSAAFAGADTVDLRWDEERGWRCVVLYPYASPSDPPDRSIEVGEDDLAPSAVADWVAGTLIDRKLPGSREPAAAVEAVGATPARVQTAEAEAAEVQAVVAQVAAAQAVAEQAKAIEAQAEVLEAQARAAETQVVAGQAAGESAAGTADAGTPAVTADPVDSEDAGYAEVAA